MSRTLRILAVALLFTLLLACLVGCNPRGTYTDALGASYRFKIGEKYVHTDTLGNVTKGKYEIEGDTITFTPNGTTPFSLPYKKEGSSLIIGEIVYKKN